MKNNLRMTFLCFYIFQFAAYYQSIADIYEYQYTPPSRINSSGSAHYKIYIPDSISTIKGVYCYVPGWQKSSLEIVNDTYYQKYVEEKDFALMGFWMTGAYTDYYYGISIWSGEALIICLKELSILSGHYELAYSALLFDGHSAGGQFSYHFTQWKPERVIAFVTMKGGYHSLSTAGDAIKVPGYMFIGNNDLNYRITNLTTIFEIHRPLGALWTLAMEPNASHDRISSDIIHSFFDQIVPMRIPEIIPTDTIPQLIEIDEEKGWLGNRYTYFIKYYSEYKGDKTKACWFPNEKIAQEWQNFVRGKPFSNIYFTINTLPEQTKLFQNYPNPFNTNTKIEYNLPQSNNVTLKIFNLVGQEIETLVTGFQTSGVHNVKWTVKGCPGGIYFYRLQAGEFSETKKLILQK